MINVQLYYLFWLILFNLFRLQYSFPLPYYF
jgi:hypothetical protein